MIQIYTCITGMMLFCFFHLPPAMAQDILKKTVKDLCVCLDETSKTDTLNLAPKQIFDKCTGATMAKNREELLKKYDMGTVSGIKALRDELVNELKQECEQFITMFSENPPKKNY